ARIVDLDVDVAADVGYLERRRDERGKLRGVKVGFGDLPDDDLGEIDRRRAAVETGGADVDHETEERDGHRARVGGLNRRADLDALVVLADLLHLGRDERCGVAREHDADERAGNERGATTAVAVFVVAVIALPVFAVVGAAAMNASAADVDRQAEY